MDLARERALELHYDRTAELLQQELNAYEEAPKMSANQIYTRIEDCLVDDPDAKYAIVIRWVAGNWGMTKAEFEKRYPKCRRVFDVAKRRALEMRAIELRLAAQVDGGLHSI